MTNTVTVLPDGTKCYSGPNCKRHGIQAQNLATFAEFNKKLNSLDENSNEADFEAPTDSEFSITIASNRMDEAVKRIDSANRKLERNGIEGRFEYTVDRHVETDKNGVSVEFSTINLNKPSIGLDGWDFEAVHQFSANGGVISYYGADADEETKDSTDEVKPTCDQCGSNRHREKVYWVKNKEGERKQVGSGCLKAFFGVKPEGLWALSDDLGLGKLGDKESAFLDSSARVYDARDLIIAGLNASENGETFLSRSAAYGGQTPTADKVMSDFNGLKATTTQEVSDMADEILAYAKTLDPQRNSYVSNLKEALGGNLVNEAVYVKRRDIPLAVSVISSWKNAQTFGARNASFAEARAAREALKASEKKSYIAPPGEKIQNIPAKVEKIAGFETDYGYQSGWSNMVVLRSEDGHIMKWTTAKDIDFKEGDSVMVNSATVKDNTIYGEDTYQTVIKLAKIEKRRLKVDEELEG
jgi:cytochrome c556